MRVLTAITFVVAMLVLGWLFYPEPNVGQAKLPIDQRLEGKTPSEKASIKSDDVVAVGLQARQTKGAVEIEITDIHKIEGGVEAFVKAWRNNRPIGFGDGTVEIERFRIFNPPILVDDPQGNIVRTWTNSEGTVIERRLREDPREALLQVIEHNIEVINPRDGSKIEAGKIGRTVSTFFPVAGANSPVDGWTQNNGATYATVRSSGTGTFAGASDTAQASRNSIIGTYNIIRHAYHFDTSALGDSDTINSATLSFKDAGEKHDGNNMGVSIVDSNPASNTDVTTADFDAFGTTKYASDFDITSWNIAGTYNDFTLNASGLAFISKTGLTKFGIRISGDVAGTTPTGRNEVTPFMADETGTTNDPKLVIDHTAGGGGGAAAPKVPDIIIFD